MIVQKLLGQPFEVGYNAMYDRVEDLIDVSGQLGQLPASRAGLMRRAALPCRAGPGLAGDPGGGHLPLRCPLLTRLPVPLLPITSAFTPPTPAPPPPSAPRRRACWTPPRSPAAA